MATQGITGLAEVRWRIMPLETPQVWRRCAKCGEIRPFYSSNQFRLNAHQRRVDVWLIYRCTSCDTTWNCTICTRRTPEEIGAELYQRFQRNDRDTAWEYAFNLGLLTRQNVRVEAAVKIRVEQIPKDMLYKHHDGQQISIVLPYPCSVRLDRLLAAELGVARSCLQRWLDRGFLQIWPADHNALRKPIRDGQVITLLRSVQSMNRDNEDNAAVAVVSDQQ